MQAEDPTDANDQMLLTDGLNGLFSRPFAGTVDPLWGGGIGFEVGGGFLAIKEIIGGQMEQFAVVAYTGGCQMHRAIPIDGKGLGCMGFGLINGSKGRCVDDDIGLKSGHALIDRVRIGNV